MYCVTVEHRPHGKRYSFKCYEERINLGDIVVVDTAVGLALGKVVGLGSLIPESKVTREVVTVVDMSDFNSRKAKHKKADEIKKKMDKRIGELNERDLYALVAIYDPAFASMLVEYDALIY